MGVLHPDVSVADAVAEVRGEGHVPAGLGVQEEDRVGGGAHVETLLLQGRLLQLIGTWRSKRKELNFVFSLQTRTNGVFVSVI